MINYPHYYNNSVNLYNENSFERLYLDPTPPKKRLMLGGRFLQRKLVVFLYYVLIICAFIFFNLNNHVTWKILFCVALTISIVYFLLHVYNLIIYVTNDYIIGNNFLEDEDSSYVDENSLYKMHLINRSNQEEISNFERHAELIHYLVNRYKITTSSFYLVFYKKAFYEYTNCGIIFLSWFFYAVILSCFTLNILYYYGLLKL
jgi:hypothetical protein